MNFDILKIIAQTNMSHYIEPFKLKYKLKIEGLEAEIKDLMSKESTRENEVKIRIAQSLLTTYNDLYKKLILWSYNEPKRIEKNRKMKIKQELEQIL